MILLETDRLQSDDEYRKEARHRFVTDHFFAAEVLGHTKFIPHLHQPAVELYFPKNPDLPIDEQHPIHKRMHLDPRKTFKTTLGRVDDAQWVVAFPETVTILEESATQPLAGEIGEAIGRYFWRPGGSPAKLVHLIAPELVFSKKPEGKWRSPVQNTLDLDATLDFTSPQSQQSGWHPWILNPDDMVDTKNSGKKAKPETRQAVIETHHTNLNTLRDGGFLNVRGTRYHPEDLYGNILQSAEREPDEWKMLIRGSLIVHSGERLLPGEFPDEDEVTLVFPELLPYKKLRTIFFDSYESFMCQQMNDTLGGIVTTFPEDLYLSTLCVPDRVPLFGDTFICWRLPYGGKDYMADYAEGAAVRIQGGVVYVIDAWQGTYTPSRLAEKIVRECKRHQTGHIMTEALPGTEYIEGHIRNEGYKKNITVRIQWLEYEEDDNSRKQRMIQIEPMMRSGRIRVSQAITKLSELKRQLLFFSLVRENGIVDCISRLAAKIPVSVMRTEIAEEEAEHYRREHDEESYRMIYEQGGVQQVKEAAQDYAEQMAQEFAMERTNSFGLPDILGGLDG